MNRQEYFDYVIDLISQRRTFIQNSKSLGKKQKKIRIYELNKLQSKLLSDNIDSLLDEIIGY